MLTSVTKFSLKMAVYLLLCTPLFAQTELPINSDSNQFVWNLVIALIVIVFTLASAALPLAAARQWQNSWSLAAKFPLFILVVWVLIIVVAKLQSIDSHRLWSFELFAWAMLNMVYMVTVMTIKRIIEKNDEKSLSSDDS